VAALFTDLHDVAQVLTEHIREEIGIVDVQPGAPRDVSATTEAGVRLTLLYMTPQPSHRSDPVERQGDGRLRLPPLALSCFYLVTASGADADDPIAAHHALGRILTLYHDNPALELPLSAHPTSPPGAFSDLGEGELTVVQVPMTLDQIDKIWMSLEAQLQPWALFEVSPVQLASLRADAPPAPLVRPGGLGLGVRAGLRPVVARVTPEAVRQGGRVRIDAQPLAGFEALSADGVQVAVGDPSLEIEPTGTVLLLTLDDGGLEALEPGAHGLTLRAGGMVSRRGTLRVAPATAPVIDAPNEGAHDPSNDLVLSGANLANAEEAVLWPDVGVAAPTDVHSTTVTNAGATTVTVSAAELQTVPPGRGPWRLAIRVGASVYTPYVLLELGS
jgi:Pvc16 N-terminal domain